MEGVGERVHAKIKTVSEARFEEEQRDSAGRERKDVRYRTRTPLFLSPPPPCVTASRGMTFVPDYLLS